MRSARIQQLTIRLLLGGALTFAMVGCQTNPNGTSLFQRPNANPLANVPLPGSNTANVWSPPSLAPPPTNPYTQPAFAPSQPVAPQAPSPYWPTSNTTNNTANPIGRLAELLRRQNEQSRLSIEQQEALRNLTAYQKEQADQLARLAEAKKRREIEKIQQQAELLQRQQMELQGLAGLRRRNIELDANNRDLHAQLAQTQQQNRLFEDQLNLIRQQLKDTSQRLAGSIQQQAATTQRMEVVRRSADEQITMAQQQASNQVAALEANLRRRGGATIRANSSVQQRLAAIQIAGLNVRQDGDVVRIELPSDQVFSQGTATLQPNSAGMIDRVAAAVRQHYPRQKIGIESHTDGRRDGGGNGRWASGHQLSAAQASAVFEQLTRNARFAPEQLFVLGHGPNYPVASNGTAAGQQRNRRVEIVVYPETIR